MEIKKSKKKIIFLVVTLLTILITSINFVKADTTTHLANLAFDGSHLAGNTGPSRPFFGNGATLGELVSIWTSDDSWWHTNFAIGNNVYDWQIYHFNLSYAHDHLDISDITELNLSWEGKSSEVRATYDLSSFVWNVDAGSWESIGSDGNGQTSDLIFSTSITSDIGDYINQSSDGNWVYMYARHKHFVGGGGGSCPFVYSYDGENWTLEHESFPVSVIKSSQRSTFDRLKNLKEVKGEYRLQIREELDEKSYIDSFKFYVVDHPGNGSIMPDIWGNVHTIKELIEPISCIEKNGNSCLEDIRAPNNSFWKDNIGDINTSNEESYNESWKNYIELTFDKPTAPEAKLFLNIMKQQTITDVWGHYIGKIGRNNWEFWQKTINLPIISILSGNILQEIIEEIFSLNIEVLIGEEWVRVDSIVAGNHMLDDFLININISKIEGDKLKIRLVSTRGFYEVYYAGIDFSEDEPMEVNEMVPYSIDFNGEENLSSEDFVKDNKYILTTLGDTIDLRYKAIEKNDSWNRDYYIEIEGYYNVLNFPNKSFGEFLKGVGSWISAFSKPEDVPKVFYEEILNKGNIKNNTLFTDYTSVVVTHTSTTCTAPGSGNWAISCSDNCTWDSNFAVPANITITGSGILTLNANISMTASKWEIFKEDGCSMVINPGGGIR